MQPQLKPVTRPQKPPLYLQALELEAQHPQTIVFIWYASGYVAYGKSAHKVKDLLGGSIQFDRWAKDKKIEFYDYLRLVRECEANDLGLMYLTTTGKIKHPIKAPVKITRLITIPEPPPLMLPAPKSKILSLPAGDAPAHHPELSEPDIIFLRAFIGTTSPLKKMQIGDTVIEFPMAYLKETQFLMKHYRRSQPAKTPDIIHLPAPVGNTHVCSNQTQSINLLGFARDCKIIETFTKYDETWVKLSKTIGKHDLIIYRKLSQISQEQ